MPYFQTPTQRWNRRSTTNLNSYGQEPFTSQLCYELSQAIANFLICEKTIEEYFVQSATNVSLAFTDTDFSIMSEMTWTQRSLCDTLVVAVLRTRPDNPSDVAARIEALQAYVLVPGLDDELQVQCAEVLETEVQTNVASRNRISAASLSTALRRALRL